MNICPICGKEELLTRHHVKPKRQGGMNTPENSFYVCRDCHNIIDRLWNEHRVKYVKIILKMFMILHKEYPDYYTKQYVYSLLWKAYGITLYELNVYYLAEYIKEYKGDLNYLYLKLVIFNYLLPDKQRMYISYYPHSDRTISLSGSLTFKITDKEDNDYEELYFLDDLKKDI